MAIHPSGMYFVIAHIDKIHIYALHTDDVAISNFRSVPILVRGCTEVSFSNGGHLFAFNDEENRVNVFKFWQMERHEYGTLQGHEGPIQAL